MHPKDFLRTIYLGDRGCKSVLVDGWSDRVILQVTTISRVRSSSGHWENYTDEDITDGLIVFTGVSSLRFDPPGHVPNDLINSLDVETISTEEGKAGGALFLFRAFVDSLKANGHRVEVQIRIEANGIHIEDPRRPEHEIIE